MRSDPPSGRLLRDLFRFYGDARRTMDSGSAKRATLGDYLADRGFGQSFQRHFLVPVVSAVWSTAPEGVLDFPVDYLLHFLDNHGLIGYPSTVKWRVLRGGSMEYVRRIVASLPLGAVRSGSPVASVMRRGGVTTVTTEDGYREDFDAVVMATHADEALAMLRDADDRERGGPRRLRLHDEPGGPPHRRANPAPPIRCVGVVERRRRRLPAARRAAQHDVPHEPAADDRRRHAVQRVGEPGAAGSGRTASSWNAR